MGDFTYKISGTSAPFMARLWDATCCCTLQYDHIEYSGQTAQFGNLLGSTCYNVSVTDRVGSIIWTGFTTPTACVAPDLPTTELSVGGYVYTNPSNPYHCYVNYTAENPREFTLSNALNEVQSVEFDVEITTCNCLGSSNYLQFSCKTTPTGTYSTFTPDYSNAGLQTARLCLNYGESICYSMSTCCNVGATESCGYTCLCLVGVTGTCVNANIGTPDNLCTDVSYLQTTTTTSTTTSPVVICLQYLDTTFWCSAAGEVQGWTCGCIALSRALVAGESVRVCLQGTDGASNGLGQTQYGVCGESWADRNNTNECYGYVCSYVLATETTTRTNLNNFYIDVTYENQSIPKVICTHVWTAFVDINTLDGWSCGQVRLSNVTCEVGANYSISGTYDRVGVMSDLQWEQVPSNNNGMCPICDASGPTAVGGLPITVSPVICKPGLPAP